MRTYLSILISFFSICLSAQYADFEKVMTGPGGHFGQGMTDNDKFVIIGSESNINFIRPIFG